MDAKDAEEQIRKAAKHERQRMTAELLVEIDDTFALLADGHGSFPSDKLLPGLKSLGFDPTPHSVDRAKSLRDISHDEFIVLVSPYLSDAGWILAEMKEAMLVFDQDGNGDLDTTEVAQIFAKLGEKITRNTLQEQVNQWSGRGGILGTEEFFQMVLDREVIPEDETH